MKIRKNKWLKLTSLLAATGAIVAVPIITTSCETSMIAMTNTPAVNKDATVVTDFESILKGFGAEGDLNKALKDILNSESGKKQIISNYSNLNNADKATIAITPIEKTENGWGGNSDYSTWKSGTTKAIVNDYKDIFTIRSLKEFKGQLNEQTLKKLLENAGVKTDGLTEIKLVENSQIGVEQKTDKSSYIDLLHSYIDLLHINVQATKAPQSREAASEDTTTKFDLGIPAANIDFKISETNLTVDVNDQKVELKTSLDIRVGTKQKIETNAKNEVILPYDTPDKDVFDVSMNDLFKKLKWTQEDADSEKAGEMKLDSSKIGKDLGMYNIEFSNPKDVTKIRLSNEGYKGMSFTFDAKPIERFAWDNGGKDTRTITINDMNVNIKDGGITTLGFSDNDPYVIEWFKIFEKSSNQDTKTYPNTLQDMKSKLTNEEFYREFMKSFLYYKEYRNNFNSVYFTFDANDITDWKTVKPDGKVNQKEEKMEYKVEMTVKLYPGHVMMDKYTIKPGQKLVFKIVESKPSESQQQ